MSYRSKHFGSLAPGWGCVDEQPIRRVKKKEKKEAQLFRIAFRLSVFHAVPSKLHGAPLLLLLFASASFLIA